MYLNLDIQLRWVCGNTLTSFHWIPCCWARFCNRCPMTIWQFQGEEAQHLRVPIPTWQGPQRWQSKIHVALFVWKECIPTMRRELKDVGCCDFFMSSNLVAVFLDWFLHFWGVYAIESPLGLVLGYWSRFQEMMFAYYTIPNFTYLHSTGQCGHRRLLGRFRKHLCRDEGTQKAGLHRWRHPRLRRRSSDRCYCVFGGGGHVNI